MTFTVYIFLKYVHFSASLSRTIFLSSYLSFWDNCIGLPSTILNLLEYIILMIVHTLLPYKLYLFVKHFNNFSYKMKNMFLIMPTGHYMI